MFALLSLILSLNLPFYKRISAPKLGYFFLIPYLEMHFIDLVMFSPKLLKNLIQRETADI